MIGAAARRIVLLDGWRRALLATLAGAVLVFGLPPFNFPAFGFLSFPVLVLLLDGAAGEPGRGRLRRLAPAFRVGWCFGFGYFVAGLWWLGAAMTAEGDAFLWAIPFAVLALPAICGVYFGLATALARAVWSDGAGRIAGLAAALALAEFLRGRLFTGFPWNDLGVLAAPAVPFMQSAALGGLHLLTLFAVLVFAAPAALLRPTRGSRAFAGFALALLALHAGYGFWRLAARPTLPETGVALRVVQPAIDQGAKWDAAEAERNFSRLLTLSRPPENAPAPKPGTTTLIVWPESAFPFLLTERPDAVARLADTIEPGEWLVAGAVRAERVPDGPARYFNSVLVIDDNGEIVAATDKTHLVPFGEYVPFEAFLRDTLGLRQIAELPGGFSAAALRRNLDVPGLPPLLALVCYEIIFGDEIDGTAARPAAFINVTNDAWYGMTPGPYQHLRQAELTAVAFGLPLVRAANTGISVVNDGYGATLDGLALGSAGALEAMLPPALPLTPFARFGNAPFWAAMLLAAAFALTRMIGEKRSR